MTIKIVFYGPLADAIAREVEMPRDDTLQSLRDLRRALADQHPHQAETITGPRTRWVLNGSFAKDDAALDSVQLVECLPPVSGG